MLNFKNTLSLIFVLVVSGNSFAGTLQCSGKVEQIGMHANDRIMLRLTSMNTPVFICSTTSSWKPSGSSYSTSPETCKALLSMFLTAKATGVDMGDVWMDGDDATESCSTFGNWKSVNIRHFLF